MNIDFASVVGPMKVLGLKAMANWLWIKVHCEEVGTEEKMLLGHGLGSERGPTQDHIPTPNGFHLDFICALDITPGTAHKITVAGVDLICQC